MMQQFTETTLPPQTLHKNSPFSNLVMNKIQPHRTRPWPGFPTSKSIGNIVDTNCMEQLLVHCANAIQTNDATLTQQILWVLNNIAPQDGDSNQRLTSGFLRALLARAAKSGNCKLLSAAAMANVNANQTIQTHKFSILELASFVDLTPWYRFGFTAANAAILEALDGYSIVHIIDMSPTHCMQIPTLIDALSTRIGGPPMVKLTVAAGMADATVPPILDLGYDELGSKLVNFARSRNVEMEFRVIHTCYSHGFASLIEHIRLQQDVRVENNEALVINCHMMLHYVPDESSMINNSNIMSLRTMFLKSIRSFYPTVVTLIDEDADFTSNDLVTRLRAAFNYMWIHYDTVDTFLPKGSKQRQWYEADICWKIENVIAHEGIQRIERLESKNRWIQRMKNASFKGVSFSEDGFLEVKNMLDEHSAGWGVKREEENLVLTWKGHNVVFATVWVPT